MAFGTSDRYMYILANMVGQNINITLRNNVRINGIFISSVNITNRNNPDNSDVMVALKFARVLSYDNTAKGDVENILILEGKDIAAIHIPISNISENKSSNTSKQPKFLIDSEIASAKTFDRKLEKWKPMDDFTHMKNVSLDDKLNSSDNAQWDQFEANARHFKVRTTYQEELYTTPLNVEKIPQSIKEKAEKIAREIETSIPQWRVDDGEDEENLTLKISDDKMHTKNSNSEKTKYKLGSNNAISANNYTDKTNDGIGHTKCLNLPAKLFPLRDFQKQSIWNFQGKFMNHSLVKNINALNLETTLLRNEVLKSESINKQAAVFANVAWPKAVLTPVDRVSDKKKFFKSLKLITTRMKRIDWSQLNRNNLKSSIKNDPEKQAPVHIKKLTKEFLFFKRSNLFTEASESIYTHILLKNSLQIDSGITWTQRLHGLTYEFQSPNLMKKLQTENVQNNLKPIINSISHSDIKATNGSGVKDTTKAELQYANNDEINIDGVNKYQIQNFESIKMNEDDFKTNEYPKFVQINQPKFFVAAKSCIEKINALPKNYIEKEGMQHLVLWPYKYFMSYCNTAAPNGSLPACKDQFNETQSISSVPAPNLYLKSNNESNLYQNSGANSYFNYYPIPNNIVLVPSSAINSTTIPSSIYNENINNNQSMQNNFPVPMQLIHIASPPSSSIISENRSSSK